MNIPTQKMTDDFKEWQKQVARELKSETPSLDKAIGLGLRVPILHFYSRAQSPLHFRLAAMSQTLVRGEDFTPQRLETAFEQGVYDFIFDPHLLGWSKKECDHFILHNKDRLSLFKGRIWGLRDLAPLGNQVIDAQDLTIHGGHGIHELGLLIHKFILWAQSPQSNSLTAIAFEMDTDFFKSIAKKRALSLMIESVLATLGKENLQKNILLMARAPWRVFTAYDFHSNILRNSTAIAAAYVSGCDIVESLPFDLIAQLDPQQRAQAERLALTSQLILQNESMLAEIRDPSFGSHTIENLTDLFVKESWSFMQRLQKEKDLSTLLKESAVDNWNATRDNFNKRKMVQTGVNDFAQADTKLTIYPRWLMKDHVRLAREFEELRVSCPKLIKVRLAVIGSYAKLQARINFTKNYFELLGLDVEEAVYENVSEAHPWLSQSKLCAWVTADELHSELVALGKRCYIAGKTQVSGCYNLFVGQDVFQELSQLSLWIKEEVL